MARSGEAFSSPHRIEDASPHRVEDAPSARSRGAFESFTLGRHALVADSSGAVYWPAQATLLVADLHLQKGAAFAERGALLPPYDTRETLAHLAQAIARHAPARVIALGDSFHTSRSATGLADDDLATLRALQAGREWIWIAGNHDPELPASVGGRLCDELTIAGLALRHTPSTSRGRHHEIAGHLHPAARLSLAGTSIRRRCFVGDGHRLVMPAFGALAGGLNVLDAAFAPLFGKRGMAVWMLGRERLYPVSLRQLRPDRC